MRKLLRTIPVLLLALGIMIAAVGGVGAQDQLTFSMVSHGGIGNPFWVVVIKGMEDRLFHTGRRLRMAGRSG